MAILCEIAAVLVVFGCLAWFLKKDEARLNARMKEWNRVLQETELRVYEDVDAPKEAALLLREQAFRNAAIEAQRDALYKRPEAVLPEGNIVPLFPAAKVSHHDHYEQRHIGAWHV